MASSIASGSNAPVIVDDLVAWPPPPSIARFGGSGVLRQTRLSLINPLSNPPSQASQPSSASGAPSSTFPGASPLTGYANARTEPPQNPRSPTLLGTSWAEEDGISLMSPTQPGFQRAYAPPRKPLSPQHLGRIAQSFGIVTPTLPEGARTSSSSSAKAYSRSPTQQSNHTRRTHTPAPSLSQQVVAVVPPVSLMPRDTESDPAAEKDREKKWRRGRLLPLQPTLGSMLVVIAREFGLPSTTGLSVYLGPNGGAYAESASGTADEGGPLVTQETWTTLFGHGAVGMGVADSPRSGSIKRFPPSALTRVDENGHAREKSSGSQPDMTRSSLSSSSSYNSPRTPGSVSMPSFGTIEFDVAPDAPWLADYRAGRRATSTEAAGGIKNLRLVDRLNDSRPKFLRDMADERERARAASQAAQAAALEAARRSAAQRETVVKEQRVRRASELERQRTRTMSQDSSSAPPTRLSLRSPVPTPPRPARSSARPPSTIEAPESSSGHSVEPEPILEEPSEREAAAETEEDLETLTPLQSRLLGPIKLPFDADRTSCMVMAHQLNHLEKMMKTLSPQDLRFTVTPGSPGSPRSPALAPHSPASGASLSPGLSPASPGSPGEALGPDGRPASEFGTLPPRGTSRLPYLQPDNRSSLSTSTESASPLPSPRRASDEGGDRSSLATLNGQPRVRSTGPPPRPARPPTPDLSTPDLVEHVLPASYVDHIKAPVAPGSRPTSMSLKGLKRQLSMRPESGLGGSAGEFGGFTPGSAGGSVGRAAGRQTTYGQYNDVAPQRRTRRESEFGTSRISRLFGRKPSIDDTRRMTIVHLSSPVGTAPPTQLVQPAHARQGSQALGSYNSFGSAAPGGGPPVQLQPASGPNGVGLSSAMTGLAGIPHARKPSRDAPPAPLQLRRGGTPSDGTMSPTSPRSNYTRRKPVPGSGSARGSMDMLSD